MDVEVKEMSKKEKIKKHFRDNKQIYIGAAVQVAIGVAAYKIIAAKIESLEVVVINNNIGGMNNRIKYQTISKYGHVIGRPGIPVIAEYAGTQQRYESMSLAAEAIGASVHAIRNQINGLKDHVNGYTFKLAE